ncbi:MAG: histidine phosphatase family protein [Candidatus Uhrbacteria bacterium]|nr:histidine phosphatase family protein [Candidatus Uhrbacteria bacterium]
MSGRHAHIQLVICRHTQTDDNVARRYSGQNDVLLNATGMEQALRLAERIAARFPVRQIVCSDLQRSWAVAREIAHACGSHPPIHRTEDLREVNVGRMANLTKEESLIQFPEDRHRTRNAHYDYRNIGGECADDVASRIARVIDQEAFLVTQRELAELPTLVIVGHGTALRTLFVDRLHAFRKIHVQGDFQVCDWLIGQL